MSKHTPGPKVCPQCGVRFTPRKPTSKYCSRDCSWANNGKSQGQDTDHEIWWVNSKGYIEGRIWRNGIIRRIKQHTYIMERHLGRQLGKNEEIHHINGVKTDNRIENLEIVKHGEHSTLHNLSRVHKSGYKMTLTPAERQRRSIWMKNILIARIEGGE